MRSETLDTGSNPAYGRHALKRAASLLQKSGYRVINPVTDRGGIYSFEMAGLGTNFYLVARTTNPMPYYQTLAVSSQMAILAHCRRDQVPLLMAIISGPKTHTTISSPEWRLFNPNEIFKDNFGPNTRGKVIFINFDYHLGKQLQDPRELPDEWHKMKKAWEKKQAAIEKEILGGRLEEFFQ